MSNQTLTIVVSTPKALNDLQQLVGVSTDPRAEFRKLEHYFQKLGSGTEHGVGTVVNASYSTAAPVQASGTNTLTYASISNNDTFTVAGTVLTCVTGTPTGAQFKKQTDGPTTAANLAALINGNATLKLICVAKAASSVVTITAIAYGKIGNQFTLATSNSTGFALSAGTLASGAGGAEVAFTAYSLG